jgi:hypothetical protein
MGFVKIGSVKARLYLRELLCLISYILRPLQIKFCKEYVHRNVFSSTRAVKIGRRTDVGLNAFLSVPSTYNVRRWWKSVQEIAHNDAEFRDHRRRKGRVFLTDVNEIAFTRVP